MRDRNTDEWRIEELDRLEVINEIEVEYRATNGGASPLNVSHWDTSIEFKSRLLPLLDVAPTTADPIDYLYSYYLPSAKDLPFRLGYVHSNVACLLTPSATPSVLAVVNWLNSQGINRLVVVGPCYFTVLHAARALNLRTRLSHMTRTDGRYELPPLSSLSKDDALWITNPVYSTGQYLGSRHIEVINEHASRGGVVVLDEALALPDRAIGPRLDSSHAFACIYSPHKAVSVNAMKFSAIVCRPADSTFFDQWSDILVGGLPLSSLAAINHFLSPAFGEYAEFFLKETSLTLSAIMELQGGHSEPTFDCDTSGNYVSCFFPRLRASLGYDRDFLRSIARETAAVFIPSLRNHFDPSLGLGFRINLARDSPLFRAALARLFAALRATSGTR